jgi:adenylosuccinate synthase
MPLAQGQEGEERVPVVMVVGGQWGDEGKGKIVDALAAEADVVVRATGGNNAGHTVENELGRFALHLVPCGVFGGSLNIIGNGVVIEPEALLKEMDELTARGIDLSRLRISERAHLVLPFHPIMDRAAEQASGEAAIGTTGRGIGPAYADKVARKGIRVCDLLDEEGLAVRLRAAVTEKNLLLQHLYGQPALDFETLYLSCVRAGTRLRPYVVEGERLVQEAIVAGHTVLVEGAQGALLDVEFGTYPYVTSSSPTTAGMCIGAGIAPTQVGRVIGVYKAYTSRVGNGPFPTEQENEIGERIRQHAREFGTTTGRPRRIGWFDAAACRTVSALNGIGECALTRLDVLDILPSLQIGTSYRLNDLVIDRLPARADLIAQLEPIYEEIPGWQTDISGARRYDDLPAAARAYVERLEQCLGLPVTMIGVGPAREQLIRR